MTKPTVEQDKGNILIKARAFLEELFDLHLPDQILFHDMEHTKEVVKAVNIICAAQGINDEQREILQLAAWFHDAGFINNYRGHEKISMEIARQALEAWQYPEERIQRVCSCIQATCMPQRPESELEKIICDADLFHLADDNYWKRNLKLKKETCALTGCVTDSSWYINNLSFLVNHSYFTTYGKCVLEERKQKNIEKNIVKIKQLLQ